MSIIDDNLICTCVPEMPSTHARCAVHRPKENCTCGPCTEARDLRRRACDLERMADRKECIHDAARRIVSGAIDDARNARKA